MARQEARFHSLDESEAWWESPLDAALLPQPAAPCGPAHRLDGPGAKAPSRGHAPAARRYSEAEDEADADLGANSDTCTTAECPLHHACAESTFSSRGEEQEPTEPGELEDAACADVSGDACLPDSGDVIAAMVGEDAVRRPLAAFPPFPPGVQAGPRPPSALWPMPMLPFRPPAHLPTLPSPGEFVLQDILRTMDMQMHMLRGPQQRLVDAVSAACEKALGKSFDKLVLVGSAALSAETPGSDLDIVCVTRRDGDEQPGSFCGIHKKVHQALLSWAKESPASAKMIKVEMIDEARVPILRLMLRGHAGNILGPVVVDVSFDQQGPIDHVEWFRRACAASLSEAACPPFAQAPIVTSMLRCIKLWLRLRQIPRNKEGGLPTMTWLLMAAHVFLSADAQSQVGVRPTAALLEVLLDFFALYSSPGGMNGVLSFAENGKGPMTSKLAPRPQRRSPWGEFSLRDPTRDGSETTLAPRMLPATQLLLAVELGRAAELLSAEAERRSGSWDSVMGSADSVAGLFTPRPEGVNSLLTRMEGGMGAILLLGDPSCDLGQLEVAVIDGAFPRVGWRAPFLHRADERSELYVHLCDVDARTGGCVYRARRSECAMVLCPCHFVCGVTFTTYQEYTGGKQRRWRLDDDSFELYRRMADVLAQMEARHQERVELPEGSDFAEEELLEGAPRRQEEPPSQRKDAARLRATAAGPPSKPARGGAGRGKKHSSSALASTR